MYTADLQPPAVVRFISLCPYPRQVLENSEDGTAPSSQSSRRQGPDEDGGWEEMKESEPPMGRLVPLCKVGGDWSLVE